MCIKINWITQNYNEWCCHNCIRGLCDINTANTKNRSVSQTLIWSDTIICIRQSSWPQKVLLNDWKSQSYLTKVEILERRGEKSDFGSRRHLRWLSVCKGKDAKSKFEKHQCNVENGSVAALILGALTTLVQHPSFVGNKQDHSASAL